MSATTIEKLLIHDPTKSATSTHVFVAHPSDAEGKTLGRIFVLTEFSERRPDHETIIKHIQETFKNAYYQTNELSIDTAFEQALEKVNLEIAQLMRSHEQDIVSRLNIVAGVAKEKYLLFAAVGNVHIFLCHKNKITDVLAGHKRYNDKVNPLKFFSHIISGSLSEQDAVIIATPAIMDYLSQEKLRRVVSDYSPTEAVITVERTLQDAPQTQSFAAIVMKRDTVAAPAGFTTAQGPTQASEYMAPQSSLARLEEKKQATNRLLTPSLRTYVSETAANTLRKIGYFIRTKILRQSPRRVQFQIEKRYYTSYATKQPKEGSALKGKLTKTSRTLFSVILGGLRFVVAAILNPKQTLQSASGATQASATFMNRSVNWFKSLSRLQKSLFVLALVIAAVFSQSIILYGKGRLTQTQHSSFEDSVAAISQKITEAEARLSYGDDAGAALVLQSAQSLVDQLPNRKKSEKEKIAELNARIESQREKTRRRTVIANPSSLADFSTLNVNVRMAELALINSTLYGLGSNPSLLASIDLSTNKLETVSENLGGSFQYSTLTPTGTLLLLASDFSLQEFSFRKSTLSKIAFSLPTTDANITDITTYENRLYLLDVRNNQIYRASKVGTGYNQAAPWIKELGVDVSTGRSITVDGYVYVALENGQVLQFLQGNRQSFALETIEPALEHSDRIWTSADSDRLYLLDAKGKRVLVFNKSGTLKRQYFSEQFSDLKDFAVREDANRVYVLNGSQVFEISLDDIP